MRNGFDLSPLMEISILFFEPFLTINCYMLYDVCTNYELSERRKSWMLVYLDVPYW